MIRFSQMESHTQASAFSYFILGIGSCVPCIDRQPAHDEEACSCLDRLVLIFCLSRPVADPICTFQSIPIEQTDTLVENHSDSAGM